MKILEKCGRACRPTSCRHLQCWGKRIGYPSRRTHRTFTKEVSRTYVLFFIFPDDCRAKRLTSGGSVARKPPCVTPHTLSLPVDVRSPLHSQYSLPPVIRFLFSFITLNDVRVACVPLWSQPILRSFGPEQQQAHSLDWFLSRAHL